MNIFKTLSVGSAGLAMIAGATAPAIAQTPYGYGNQGGSTVGTIINSVLGGGRYGSYGQGNDRQAVDQCARAAEIRVSGDGRYGTSGQSSYGAYGQGDPRYGQGDPRYGQSYRTNATARVVAVTSVERRSSGLRVTGLIDTGSGYGGRGYEGQNYQGQNYQGQAYGDPRYAPQAPGQGMDPRYSGSNNQGYANAAQNAELKFNCRVDYRGQITKLSIDRNDMIRRGY